MRTRIPPIAVLALSLCVSSAPAAAVCVRQVDRCFGGEAPGEKPGRTCFSHPKSRGVAPGTPCAEPDDGLVARALCSASGEGELECCDCNSLQTILVCFATPVDRNTMRVYVQAGRGLWAITEESDNATFNPPIPFFPVGYRDLIVLRVTKDDPNQRARVKVTVVDIILRTATCDPVLTLVVREPGTPVRQSIPELPQAESNVTVLNDTPGLRNLQVIANGREFRMTGLRDGEVRTLDVASAMLPGDRNIITLIATGAAGLPSARAGTAKLGNPLGAPTAGSATVMIHD